jgi:hypothetical protein
MGNINSEYDDYNSTSPILGGTAPLCFSSNLSSGGKNFDVIYKLLDVIKRKTNGEFIVAENNNDKQGVYLYNLNLNNAVTRINTNFNELGPYLIHQGIGELSMGSYHEAYNIYMLLYANDESGNLNIKFTENETNYEYSVSRDIVFLNSQYDDAYPCLTSDNSSIYFCSNRTGNFDIYKANIYTPLVSDFKNPNPRTITRDSILSSSFDDKCPFILRKLMVYASNRPGGFGGYDLYYSIYDNFQWSEPENFGENINSQFDEFRPIVKAYEKDFTNDFMIFSSNRPGGKGGFDLYYVGINKMTK